MFNLIRAGFKKFPPHSEERRRLKHVLGEYFCAYQEVRLIEEARLEAKKRGATLIYRNEDGGFSLHLPDTPTTRNLRLKKIIMKKREIYRKLAPKNKIDKIQAVSKTKCRRKLTRYFSSEDRADKFLNPMFFKQPPPTNHGEQAKNQSDNDLGALLHK